VLMFIQVASMGFIGCMPAGKPRPMWRGAMLVVLGCELCAVDAAALLRRRCCWCGC
jgi:hypothetical protein